MKDTMMYNLDIDTMMQVMQIHQQTGVLQANVSPKAAGVKETGRIEVAISSGSMVSCTITYNSGRRLVGKKAHQELVGLGRLDWTFTPQLDLPIQSKPASHNSGANTLSFPQRVASPAQQVMSSWPRMHRQVFALIDGTKSCTKIAEILSRPPSVIEQVLGDLQEMRVILFKQQDSKDLF